ncbi:MAG: hypothetical protein AB7K71_29970 [Polyangiaceae bacterium]
MSSRRWLLLGVLAAGCAQPVAPHLATPTAQIVAPPPVPEPSAAPSCSPTLDTEQLLSDLRTVKGDEARYNELLQGVGFAPLESIDGLPEETTWSLEDAKLQDLQLKPEGQQVLLSLRFEYGMFRSAMRVAILQRVGKALCPLSLEPSRDIDGFSCLSDGEPPFSIESQRIVSQSWDTLVINLRSGRCDGYSVGRGAHHEVELWGFVGEEFKRLYQTETFDAWYTSPIPPLRTLERKLEFVGEVPKSLLVTTDVTCDRSMGQDPEEACEEEHSEQRLTYQKGQYE